MIQCESNKKVIVTLKQTNNTSSSTSLDMSYWDSSEAKVLFQPSVVETIQASLCKRIDMLSKAIYSDDRVLCLLDDIKIINDITSKQRQSIRMYCMYLKKAYELALQYICVQKWKTCIRLAINELADVGITDIKDEKTIRLMNCHFRKIISTFLSY